MNESAPKQPEKDVSTYESKVKKGYSEFGNEGVGVENWGTMVAPTGERFNGYTDNRFINYSFTEPILRSVEGKEAPIKIADLGGDDGFLLNEVLSELRKQNPNIDATGLVVDVDSTGKARQKFAERQEEGSRQNIDYIVADITKLPFDDETLDVVITRMTMQYLDKEQQERFLRDVARVLKKEGLCLVQTITDEGNNKEFNEVWAEITELISETSDFKRRFPWFGEFTKRTAFTEEYGLAPIFGSKQIAFPFSVPAFAERFRINTEELTALYKTQAKKFPELFEVVDGELCLKGRLLNLRFQKV